MGALEGFVSFLLWELYWFGGKASGRDGGGDQRGGQVTTMFAR